MTFVDLEAQREYWKLGGSLSISSFAAHRRDLARAGTGAWVTHAAATVYPTTEVIAINFSPLPNYGEFYALFHPAI
jgi:hypothetical protein